VIRLGVPQFIAARPLIYCLMLGGGDRVEYTYNEPAILSDALSRGQLDAALIPSIEYLRGTGHFYVAGPALVARPGRANIILVARRPLAELERVAVSEFCRTPVAALRVVLSELHDSEPDLLVEKNHNADWRERYDAILLSGDAALRRLTDEPVPGDTVHNVTSMWSELTGQPLVAALWVYSDPAIGTELSRLLLTSRNLGVQNLSHLCDGISQTSQYDSEFLYDYLSNGWSYELHDNELTGLRTLEEHGLRFDLLRTGRMANAPVL